jgi:RNA polymerase sigma-70 factor, ECF subfamily
VDATLDQAQRGDRAAVEALLHKHRGGIYRYGLTVCPTTEDAEDAVQQTLWQASRGLGAFRRASTLTTWLFTIVRNYCQSVFHRRTRAERHQRLSSADTGATQSPEVDAVLRERRELVAEAFSELEPDARQVLLLRDVAGMTAPEAAAELNISIAALKSRLHRARELLATRLAERGITSDALRL